MRIMRVILAAWMFSEAWRTGEGFLYAASAFFGLQAIFNLGCAGGACAVPSQQTETRQTSASSSEEVNFEEVK